MHAFDRDAARGAICRNLYLGESQDCLSRCFDVNYDILTMGEIMLTMASCMAGRMVGWSREELSVVNVPE